MLVQRTKKLLVRSICVGSDVSYFHEQTVDPDQAALFAKALKCVSMR